MIDIDNFKTYNDTYGHIAGDILLKGLGKLFIDFFSKIPEVMVCRFGGEEFSVFLPNIDKRKAKVIAEELRVKTQAKRFILRRQETNITISIGLSALTADTPDAQDLILKADAALYNAKHAGRNQVCIS